MVLFADSVTPSMKIFESLAYNVTSKRIKITNKNKFWYLQESYSHLISEYINNFQQLRDRFYEQMFFNLWTNPYVQKFWGTDIKKPRYTPSETKLNREYLLNNFKKDIDKYTPVKTELEAFIRFVIMLIDQNKSFTDRVAQILIQHAHKIEPKLSHNKLYNIIKHQAMVVAYNNEAGLLYLKKYCSTKDNYKDILKNANEVAIQIGGELSPSLKKYLDKITKLLESK